LMQYKRLGKTGLRISPISLGTNNFGAQVSAEESVRIVKRAIDLGINIIDTANIYTQGKSEELIGRAVGGGRNDLVIATKVGLEAGNLPNDVGLSRKHILRQVEESLKRLQTDYIDLYYLHRFDENTPLEETLRTMDVLVKVGKVRYVACSNFTVPQIEEARRVCERLDLERIVAVQPQYNLLQRDPEKELLSYCSKEGLGVLTYSPLAGGFLTGKYKDSTSLPDGSRGAYNPRFRERLKNLSFSKLDRMRDVAKEHHIPLHHLAIAWILNNPAVTAPIVGASRAEQLDDTCKVLEETVPKEVFQALEETSR
jgi:1-deoxyxylulose-5-phosphate synthase